MKEYYLSVVVPIYNAEPYLRQCVDSILANNSNELEVILVDDGSTDRGGSICDEYAENSECVRTIHQTNNGATSARNKGAVLARGKFLTFVDSDDFVDNNLYGNVIEVLKDKNKHKKEMVITAFKIGNSVYSNNINDGVYDEKEIEQLIIPAMLTDNSFQKKIIPALWVKYFPTDVYLSCIDRIYNAVRDGEDVLTSIACVMQVNRVCIMNNIVGYNYRVLPKSMSNEYFSDYFDNSTIMCKCLRNIISDSTNKEKLKESVMYNEAYMLYRYVDRIFFGGENRNYKDRLFELKTALRNTIMGNSLKKISIKKMKISYMLKMELFLLQHNFVNTAYFLRRIERKVQL